MKLEKAGKGVGQSRMPAGGLTGWLLSRFDARRKTQPRLAVLERIALAPRQSLALVEADGRRFLVATSPEGTPAFYPLDQQASSSESLKASPGSGRW